MRLNEKDITKIASFYRSIGTLVFVGRSLATLYTSDFDAMANLKDWKQLYTGVPIWLFNTGMNPKRSVDRRSPLRTKESEKDKKRISSSLDLVAFV